MESVTAMLIVLFQLFFGWCGVGELGEPPAPQCEAGSRAGCPDSSGHRRQAP